MVYGFELSRLFCTLTMSLLFVLGTNFMNSRSSLVPILWVCGVCVSVDTIILCMDFTPYGLTQS